MNSYTNTLKRKVLIEKDYFRHRKIIVESEESNKASWYKNEKGSIYIVRNFNGGVEVKTLFNMINYSDEKADEYYLVLEGNDEFPMAILKRDCKIIK